MYNKIFKNYQINVGNPFQVRTPINHQHIIRPATIHPSIQETEIEEEFNETLNEAKQIQQEELEALIQKAHQEAELIIKEAHYEAARIMDDAQEEVTQLKEKALEEGRAQGYDEGYQQAQQQYTMLINQAEEIRSNAQEDYSKTMSSIETDAMTLILEIARKVITEEVSLNRDNLLFLIRQAFGSCSNKDDVILRVSPEDFDFTNENRERLLSMIDSVGELDIRKDSSLKQGGCIVETPFGNVDGSVNTILDKIEASFKQILFDTYGG